MVLHVEAKKIGLLIPCDQGRSLPMGQPGQSERLAPPFLRT
jgi:hypothetical protein